MGKRRSKRHCIFISYSHSDKKWLERLLVPLKPLVRDDGLELWTDRDIPAGSEWEQEIKGALDSAKVAVLLVSPDFMASDFIARVELPSFLDAAQKEGLTVLWVAVSDTRYKKSGIARYAAAINPSKPLDGLSAAAWKKALNQVAEQIEKASRETRPAKRIARAAMDKPGVNGVKTKRRTRLPSTSNNSSNASGHLDADHCVNQFIDRVSGGNDAQTAILRCMLRKVMIDGLLPEDVWEMLGLDPNSGRRYWFIAVQQFRTHFNRFVNRLSEFREAIQAPL